MSALNILTKLVRAGMTVAGACGMYGNIMAESSGKSNIAQRGMTSLSDDEYTTAADSGRIDFQHDNVGFGLCQWTLASRKANLMKYAKEHGVSVGNEDMQLDFIIHEMKTESEFLPVWNSLCSTSSVYDAADIVCRKYERPAINNVQDRANFGNSAYTTYKNQLTELKSSAMEAVTPTATMNPPSVNSLPVLKNDGKAKANDSTYLALLLQIYGYEVMWNGLTNAVKAFQKDNGLTVDGICGQNTWKALLGQN